MDNLTARRLVENSAGDGSVVELQVLGCVGPCARISRSRVETVGTGTQRARISIIKVEEASTINSEVLSPRTDNSMQLTLIQQATL